jgi:hypothetical protein
MDLERVGALVGGTFGVRLAVDSVPGAGLWGRVVIQGLQSQACEVAPGGPP